MAEYQGLTVSFGADTKAFDKSVGGINSALKALKQDITQLNRQLKFDPTSIELLTTKTENFRKQIEFNNKKIADWKTELAGLDEKDLGGRKWLELTQKIKAAELTNKDLNAAIEATESQLKAIENPKSFFNLQKEANELSSEIETVNRKLKLDPSNVELIGEKFELVKKQVQNSEDRVEALKEAKNQLGSEKLNTDEWKKLSREINSAEADTMELKAELERVEKQKLNGTIEEVDKLGEASKKTAKEIDKKGIAFGAMAGVGATLANKAINTITGSIGQMVKRSDTLSTASRNFQNMGASAEEAEVGMEKLVDAIDGLPTTADDAVESVQLLFANTQDMGKSVKTFESVNNAVLGFGGTAAQTTRVSELLARSFSSGRITGGQFNQMMTNGMGPALTALSDKMGITMDELQTGLSDGTISVDEFADALADMNENGSGEMASFAEMAQDANATIGTAFERMQTAVVRAGASVVEKIGPTLIETADRIRIAISKAASKMIEFLESDDGQALIETLKNVAKWVGDKVGVALTLVGEMIKFIYPIAKEVFIWILEKAKEIYPILEDGLRKAFDKIKDVLEAIWPTVENVFGFIIDNKDIFMSVSVGILAVVAAFKAWNIALGVSKVALSTYKAVVGIATKVKATFNAVMLANPLVAIAVAVLGVVSALVYFFTQTDKGREIWQKLVQAFNEGVEKIKEWFSNLWETLVNIWSGTIEFFVNLWEGIKEIFFNTIEAIHTFFVETVPQMISDIITFFKELPGKLWEQLKKAFDKVKQWGADIITWIATEVPKFIANIITFFKQLPGKLWEQLVKAFNRVKQWGTDIITWIATEVPKFINNIITFFKELPGKLWEQLKKAFDKIGDWGTDILAWAKEEIPKIVTDIIDRFKQIPVKIVQVGTDIVKGLWEGIKNVKDWILGKISGFVDDIMSGIKNFFGINSPSRVMRDEVGRHLPTGLAVGILNGIPVVLSAAEKMKESLMDCMFEMDDMFDDLFNGGAYDVAIAGIPNIEGMSNIVNGASVYNASTSTTNLNIHVNANNSSGSQIAKDIERQMVRRLNK